jgi:DNA-binding transcriptional ArsR family regulator
MRSYISSHKEHDHYISNNKIKFLKKVFKGIKKNSDLINIVRNLSDPTKFKVYLLLHRVKEVAVSDISYILDISQSTVSHALSDLQKMNLIKSHRCGQLICYSLNRQTKNRKKAIKLFNKIPLFNRVAYS